MKRLFIRFYLGVLFILFCAWSIQAYVFRPRTDAANIQVVEEALGGGVRLFCDKLAASSRDERADILAHLQSRFDYPVRVVSIAVIPSYARERISRGDDVVLMGRDDAGYIVSALAGGEEAVEFGPLPKFAYVGPSQAELMTGLGLVLLLAAGAIALLLRPVAKQLRLIERTASEFASGNFSARVDERKVKSAGTLAHAFNNMAGRTQAMLRTQQEMLQAVSHELRTPLSRIHFAIDLIRETQDSGQRELRLCSLEHAAQELDNLVGELLRYVRLETSEPPMVWTDIELLPAMQDLIEKHSLIYPSISFTLATGIVRGDLAVRADAASLERSIGNLLANAGRFANRQVVIDAKETAEGVVVDVDDDGPGIAAADRERIFDPFVRLDESSRGAGLGLAIVRRIVSHHGGSAAALESPLGGCRMRSVWPRPTQPSTPATRKSDIADSMWNSTVDVDKP